MITLRELISLTEPHTTIYIRNNEGNELLYIAPHTELSIYDAVCESEYADYEVIYIRAFSHSLRIYINLLDKRQ